MADEAAPAVSGTTLKRATASFVGLFAMLLGALWLMQEPAPAEFVGTAPDPLAWRRQPAAAPTPEAPVPPPADSGSKAFDASPFDQDAVESDADSALAALEQATAAAPENADAHRALGQRLLEKQQYNLALSHLERAAALQPTAGANQAALGRAYAQMRRWTRAIEAYRRAQQLLPDDPSVTFELALAMHESGNNAEAVEAFTRAISLNPADASYRMALAISYEGLNRKADAAAAYGEYLRLAPSDPDADRVQAKIASLREGL